MYLMIVAVVAIFGGLLNRLGQRKSFFPDFSDKTYRVLRISGGTGGMSETSEKMQVMGVVLVLTVGAAIYVFAAIPLATPFERFLAVVAIPVTGVAMYIAVPLLALILLLAVIALVGWGIYSYVK
jgi:hypothetical protein